MTESELTAIRARLAAVPAGPWWVDAGGPDETCDLVTADNREIASFPFYAPFRNEGVEKFVANAPTDIALLLSEVDRLKAELAEALATLANERGEGEPPCEGWVWTDCAGWGWAWVFGGGPDEWIAVHHKPGAGWYVRLGSAFMWMHAQVAISYATARAAIRDASAAKGGAR